MYHKSNRGNDDTFAVPYITRDVRLMVSGPQEPVNPGSSSRNSNLVHSMRSLNTVSLKPALKYNREHSEQNAGHV